MRSSGSVGGVERRAQFLGLPQPALTATTFCVTSAATISGAFAQTAQTAATNTASGPAPEQVTVTGVRSLINDKVGAVQDAPQTINVISQEVMQQQAVTRLEDALKNVPGITLNAGEGAARGDTVNLRGFPAFNDFFLDGIRDAAIYTRDSFDLESVEVLKGPSAILFGRGSTGGVINQVSKAPTLSPLKSGTLQFGTNNDVRGTIDVDQPLSDTAAIRLNAMDERSEVADRDHVRNERWGFAPSIALGIGTDTQFTANYVHQEENNIPDVGIPFLNGRPAPVARNLDFGLASDRVLTVDDIVTARLKHDFNRNLSISETLRAANYNFDNRFDGPNFGREVITPGEPLSQITVGRDRPASQGNQSNLTSQTDLTARFDTGPLSHLVKTGIEISRETLDLGRYLNPFNSNNNWIPQTPLLNPNPEEPLPIALPVTTRQHSTGDELGAYVNDTLSITDYVDLIGGVRFDRFGASFNQHSLVTFATTHLDHTDYVTSPRAAIVVKPSETQRYYFSYGTSFDPSAEALSLTATTANLKPVKSDTYEVGTKLDWLGGMLTTSGALFRTEVTNAQTNDPDHPNVTILAGNQKVDGFEFDIEGHITPEWEILAGYTYLDAKTVASGNPAAVGKFLLNTARNAINLWTSYYITDDIEVGAGGNWLGKRFADIANTASIPGYVVWNASVSYKVTDNVTLQLNGENLFDKTYYANSYFASAAENHVIPGAGRTFLFSTSFTF
ncbi:MAG TPA: TonB-dependent siderophore receptor [Aliidongia sp.]|nr:TonB-dependent siderophore receptor [Aliidongia sp.]